MFDSGSHRRSLGDSVNAGEGCALPPPLMETREVGAREGVWGRPREEHLHRGELGGGGPPSTFCFWIPSFFP